MQDRAGGTSAIHLARPRRRDVPLPSRGPGAMAVIEYGPDNRPVDLVFSHATGFNALTYRTLLAPLARQWRILSLDLRGHGATSLDTSTESFVDWGTYRDDLLALLDTLGLRNLLVAGHSMGATSSALAAAQDASRIKALVLCDPVIIPPEMRPSATSRNGGPAALRDGALRRRADFADRAEAMAAYRGRGPFRGWPETVLQDYVEAGFNDTTDGQVTLACRPVWEAATYGAQAHDGVDALLAASCPVTILRAQTNPAFFPGDRETELATTGRIHIETVPDTTHFLPMERPDRVRQALEAVLTA